MLKWPDDTEPPSQEFVTRTDNGDPATVSEWKKSSHTGTHMDARMHFIPGGWPMEALDLSRSVGLAGSWTSHTSRGTWAARTWRPLRSPGRPVFFSRPATPS